MVNIMVADDLVIHWTRASTTMLFICFFQNIPVLVLEGFIPFSVFSYFQKHSCRLIFLVIQVPHNKIWYSVFWHVCEPSYIPWRAQHFSNSLNKMQIILMQKMPANCQTLHPYVLTHWGQVTHIYAGKLTIIGSDIGLLPGRPQAIIWTNAGILLIRLWGTNFSKILINWNIFIQEKAFENVVWTMAVIFSRPQSVNIHGTQNGILQ